MLGLAFKPNTGDAGEWPAVALVEALLAKARASLHDSVAMGTARATFGDTIARAYDAAQDGDAVFNGYRLESVQSLNLEIVD